MPGVDSRLRPLGKYFSVHRVNPFCIIQLKPLLFYNVINTRDLIWYVLDHGANQWWCCNALTLPPFCGIDSSIITSLYYHYLTTWLTWLTIFVSWLIVYWVARDVCSNFRTEIPEFCLEIINYVTWPRDYPS